MVKKVSRDALILAELRAHGRVRFEANGSCMSPVFQDRDLVEVHAVEALDLKVGDIALVEIQGQLKLHRLAQKRGHRVTTKPEFGPGDASQPIEQVYGLLTAVNKRPLSSVPYERFRASLCAALGRR
jgi:hypothetical protein